MIFPCPNRIRCPGQTGTRSDLDYDYPLLNLTAEDPDKPLFVATDYGNHQIDDPPTGYIYENPDVTGTCVDDTQTAADECAYIKKVGDENDPGSGGTTGGGGGSSGSNGSSTNWSDPDGNPVTTYWNTEQTATYTCSNGRVITETTPAHTFQATSQALANALALQAAEKKLDKSKCAPVVAATPTTQYVCAGNVFSDISVTVSAAGDYTVATSGMPSGMSSSKSGTNTWTLSGSSSSGDSGSKTITFSATDSSGNTGTATIIVIICKITNSNPFPDAYQNEPYGWYLEQSGGPSTLTWAVNPGFGMLPDGLYLETDGSLWGTPTTMGKYSFQIQLVSPNNQTICFQQFDLEVKKRSTGLESVNCSPLPVTLYIYINGSPSDQNWLSGPNTFVLPPNGTWDWSAAKWANLGKPIYSTDVIRLSTDPAGTNVVWTGTYGMMNTGSCID